MKTCKFTVPVKLYDIAVTFYFMEVEQFIRELKRDFGSDLADAGYSATFAGLTVNLEKDFQVPGAIAVLVKDFYDELQRDPCDAVALLSHECLHAATAIMSNRMIPVIYENDEALAYIQDFLLGEALRQGEAFPFLAKEARKNG